MDEIIKKLSIAVIIPAYNEAEHIGSVLSRLPAFKEVIIVDDGSQDNTAELCCSLGYRVITHAVNRGKGRACITGAQNTTAEWCFFLDGDGQIDPADMLKMLPYCPDHDLIIGQRSGSVIPITRRIANFLLAWSVNVIYKTKFADVQSGLRGIRREQLLKMDLTENRYQFDVEILLRSLESGLRIMTVPITVSYKIGSRMPLKSAFNITGWFISYAFKYLRRKAFSR
jgi:glycosyltransferase involved in cell wall biosynthesis